MTLCLTNSNKVELKYLSTFLQSYKNLEYLEFDKVLNLYRTKLEHLKSNNYLWYEDSELKKNFNSNYNLM